MLLDSDSQPIHPVPQPPRSPHASLHAQCVCAVSPPRLVLLLAHLSPPSLYHRSSPIPPIVPVVVEATRDIVSMSSALSPRYLFVTKYLYRLASLSSRCRRLCCIGSLHFLSSLFSLHTRIDPTTSFPTGAPCPCIVHSGFFWTHVVVTATRFITTHPPPLSPSSRISKDCVLCGRHRLVSDYLLISLSLTMHLKYMCASHFYCPSCNPTCCYTTTHQCPVSYLFQIRDLFFFFCKCASHSLVFLLSHYLVNIVLFFLTRFFFFGRLDQRSSLFCIFFLSSLM